MAYLIVEKGILPTIGEDNQSFLAMQPVSKKTKPCRASTGFEIKASS